MSCDIVELLPDPTCLMYSMRYVGYTLNTALADIIDNSIAAGASSVSVQYRWNDGKPWIAIIDDGCGMSKTELTAAMRFGGEVSPAEKRNPSDLGRFGLGLKTASLSQCKKLTVISKKNNVFNACIWDVDAVIGSSTWSVSLPSIGMLKEDDIINKLLSRLESISSGTIVLWQKIDNLSQSAKKGSAESNFSDVMGRASEHIGSVFHRYFIKEKGSSVVRIDFNDTIVEGVNPFGLAVPARQELQQEIISLEGQEIVVQPFVLPHSSKISKQDYEKYGGEDGYLHNQGFYVYRNRRLITKATWFRIIPKTELYKLLRIRIDIPNSLDHLWQLDVKKSTVTPPLVVLARLRELLPSLKDRGRRPYTKRGTRPISDTVYMWRREFSNNKVSYVLNEEHPFVKPLVMDANGEVDKQKLSFLRIISGAFPTESFHVDVNNDTKTVIVSAAQKNEIESAVRDLIAYYVGKKLEKSEILEKITRYESPVSRDRLNEILEEVLKNGKD